MLLYSEGGTSLTTTNVSHSLGWWPENDRFSLCHASYHGCLEGFRSPLLSSGEGVGAGEPAGAGARQPGRAEEEALRHGRRPPGRGGEGGGRGRRGQLPTTTSSHLTAWVPLLPSTVLPEHQHHPGARQQQLPAPATIIIVVDVHNGAIYSPFNISIVHTNASALHSWSAIHTRSDVYTIHALCTIKRIIDPVVHTVCPILHTNGSPLHTIHPLLHTIYPTIHTLRPIQHTLRPVKHTIRPLLHTISSVLSSFHGIHSKSVFHTNDAQRDV